MIIRPETKDLFRSEFLTNIQKKNSDLNRREISQNITVLSSLPRRIVLELTNQCNIDCIMCGRNAASFSQSRLDIEHIRWLEPILNTVEEVAIIGWGEQTTHPHFSTILQILSKYDARKYLCTNGMLLDTYMDELFQHHLDICGISLDGAEANTNNKIRRGSDFDFIIDSIEKMITIKRKNNYDYPYISFVFCAMKTNIYEFTDLISLAHRLGVNKVKFVYFTAFDRDMAHESLVNSPDIVADIFEKAVELAIKYNIDLELPYIQGQDPAKNACHRECSAPWRDFYLGSDGFIRPCMHSSQKLAYIDTTKNFDDIWNSLDFQLHRAHVNIQELMNDSCRNCYHSSFCNWNRESSFIQYGNQFSPNWNEA